MRNLAFVLTSLLMALANGSKAQAQGQTQSHGSAPVQCQNFNVQGLWNDDHGGTFKLKQSGCNSVTLFDIKSQIPWEFDFRQGVDTTLPYKYIKNFAGETMKTPFENTRISGQMGSYPNTSVPVITLKARTIINLPGLTEGSRHRMEVEGTAEIYPMNFDTVKTKTGEVENRINGLSIQMTDIHVLNVDASSVDRGQASGFVEGANVILKYVTGMLHTEIHRKLIP